MLKKRIVITISLIIILLVCLIFYINKKEKVHIPIDKKEYIVTEHKKELLNYFKEIALKSEFGNNPNKITKWTDTMLLHVIKEEEYEPQMQAIKNVIDKINRLATDGFKIVLTSSPSKSNATLYLCDINRLSELAPYFHYIITERVGYNVSGYVYSEFMTDTNIIDKSLIFINSEKPLDVQESTILEEITQSLGLTFDSKKYVNSIFYADKSEQKNQIKKYSKLDEGIVKLLHHPKMKPGLNSLKLDSVIIDIFKSEK